MMTSTMQNLSAVYATVTATAAHAAETDCFTVQHPTKRTGTAIAAVAVVTVAAAEETEDYRRVQKPNVYVKVTGNS